VNPHLFAAPHRVPNLPKVGPKVFAAPAGALIGATEDSPSISKSRSFASKEVVDKFSQLPPH